MVEILFFTREGDFHEFYGKDYFNSDTFGTILGTHQHYCKNYYLFYIKKRRIGINLSMFSYLKAEDKIIDAICKTIDHEVVHESLDELKLSYDSQHWATGILGLNGI